MKLKVKYTTYIVLAMLIISILMPFNFSDTTMKSDDKREEVEEKLNVKPSKYDCDFDLLFSHDGDWAYSNMDSTDWKMMILIGQEYFAYLEFRALRFNSPIIWELLTIGLPSFPDPGISIRLPFLPLELPFKPEYLIILNTDGGDADDNFDDWYFHWLRWRFNGGSYYKEGDNVYFGDPGEKHDGHVRHVVGVWKLHGSNWGYREDLCRELISTHDDDNRYTFDRSVCSPSSLYDYLAPETVDDWDDIGVLSKYNMVYNIAQKFWSDDDFTAPAITIAHYGGNTDANPGYWRVNAWDSISGIRYMNVEIDGNLVGTSNGDYNVPKSPGTHRIRVEARNNDYDYPGFLAFLDSEYNSEVKSITIRDDDITPPNIGIEYVDGDYTDNNPGKLVVTSWDRSGLSVDPTTTIDFNDITQFPDIIGTYHFNFIAIDGDNDRSGDSLTTTRNVDITIVDDDMDPPIVDIEYTGDGTDGNPGKFIVKATDASGVDPASDPTGIYILKSQLGTYYYEFKAIDLDNDRPEDTLETIVEKQVTIVDDDTTPPNIELEYIGDWTDENPGVISVMASDASGLSADPTGFYNVPNEPGTYTISFSATDDDNDREGDSITSTKSITITIVDDDEISPIIEYDYTGDGTDGNPGQIVVDAFDDSGLYQDPSGYYDVPNSLGIHPYTFTAIDDDNDRPLDSLKTTLDVSIEIIDDDIDPPELIDLVIEDTILNLHINFTAIDYSTGDDLGLGEIIIFIDGEVVLTILASMLGAGPYYGLTIPNDWITQLGEHQLTVEVNDADNDRLGDELSSTISCTFITTFEETKDFVYWEIEELDVSISETPDDAWKIEFLKNVINYKLSEVMVMITEGEFRDAYNKLLHDIKPKITGLKKNWITDEDLQKEYEKICEEILFHLEILINNS